MQSLGRVGTILNLPFSARNVKYFSLGFLSEAFSFVFLACLPSGTDSFYHLCRQLSLQASLSHPVSERMVSLSKSRDKECMLYCDDGTGKFHQWSSHNPHIKEDERQVPPGQTG